MNLVPYPQKLTKKDGSFNLENKKTTVSLQGEIPICIEHKLNELGIPFLHHKNGTKLSIKIGENPNSIKAPEQPEGYSLSICPEGLSINANDIDGLFWGLTTLQQLKAGKDEIPCVEITDWPKWGLRYHHDDISRKQISTLDDFKRIIRLLSYYKIKYYTPYMEDVLFIKSYPDIGENRGRLSAEEVNEILKEAKKYNITVFPTYSLIGHQENLFTNPKYLKYAKEVFQEPSSYDPSKKNILRPYLQKIIKDVCEMFPDSPYFHACFDETQGVCEEDLTSHANWCADEIAKHGKKMLMWVDMWKNHFGISKIKELSSNIIPVEWNYRDPTSFEKSYAQEDVIPIGLAGYNNWCCFLPNFSLGKTNINTWAEVMTRWNGQGFGCSMWGDYGYENSRDLCWNLYAYFGEVTWRGESKTEDFEVRFQNTFYGKPLPILTEIIEDLSVNRKIPVKDAWQCFRYSIQAMVRLTINDKQLTQNAKDDIKNFKFLLQQLSEINIETINEPNHINQFAVALEREINVRERMVLASEIANGLNGETLENEILKAIANIKRVKDLYTENWLRTNKKENIEVSLAVYDEVEESLKQLLLPAAKMMEKFEIIDLTSYYNEGLADCGGLPLKPTIINDVPFDFSEDEKTYHNLKQETPLCLTFKSKAIKDIHIIYGGQTIDKQTPKDVIKVELLLEDNIVFSETLKSITHICDWWAPIGGSIWAGGGYKYVDKSRSLYAIKSGDMYGLMHLHNFPIEEGIIADTLKITSISEENFMLFSTTIENR
jgi:hypothetical protein